MSLKFCNGGSKIKFSQNNECCVPFCGATRESNRTLPFYTFPTDAAMRQEWLNLINISNKPIHEWDKLYSTLVVCSKHFQPHNGGMKLFIEDEKMEDIKEESTSSVISDETLDETTSFRNFTVNSISTQTYDDEWIGPLKKKYAGIQIKCSVNIQCRTCARNSVQAMSIYDKCNLQLNLESLINTYLPIQVDPKDSKPLNICVDCFFKLKQFSDFFNSCDENDKLHFGPNKIKNNSSHLNPNKNNNNEVIILSDSENGGNCDVSLTKDRSKLSKITSNPHNFIKKESRKHKIKILVSTKANCSQNNEVSTENSCTSKVIDVEFVANYIISHGVEWIHEINVNEDQVKTLSQDTIDHIFKVIKSTMKKQCDIHNSKVVPSPMSQSSLDGIPMLQNQFQIRTKSVITDGKMDNN